MGCDLSEPVFSGLLGKKLPQQGAVLEKEILWTGNWDFSHRHLTEKEKLLCFYFEGDFECIGVLFIHTPQQ